MCFHVPGTSKSFKFGYNIKIMQKGYKKTTILKFFSESQWMVQTDKGQYLSTFFAANEEFEG